MCSTTMFHVHKFCVCPFHANNVLKALLYTWITFGVISYQIRNEIPKWTEEIPIELCRTTFGNYRSVNRNS